MSRNNGNTKKKRRHGRSYKPQTGLEEPEPPKEELIAQAQAADCKRKTSAGSNAVHNKIFREEAEHERLVTAGLRKACVGAGLLKDDPAIIQRVDTLRKRAAHNLLLRQEAGLEKF